MATDTPPQPAVAAGADAGISPVAVVAAAVAGLGVLAIMYQKFFANVGSQAKAAVQVLPQAVAEVRVLGRGSISGKSQLGRLSGVAPVPATPSQQYAGSYAT